MSGPTWFRWLGVAGIELRQEDEILLVDPFFSRPPLWRMWLGRVEPNHTLVAEKIRAGNYILVTHAHWDHLMDVPDVAVNTGATVLGSAQTCQLLRVCGVPAGQIREIQAGDRLDLGPFRIQVLPAEHIHTPGFLPGPLPANLQPPLRLRDYRMDGCFGFLLEAGGQRLLDWASMRVEPAPKAEVLWVGAGQERAYYEALLRAVRPRLVIPLHWDDLFRPLHKPLRPFLQPPRRAIPPLKRVDLGEFTRTIRSIAEVEVLVPEIFQEYDLQGDP